MLLDRRFRADLTPPHATNLAKNLAVSECSLRSFGLGWQIERELFTFPMRDAAGRTVGFRTRSARGDKRCVPGSSLGIFVPELTDETLDSEWLLICEGPSDAAAALDLGFHAIARPDCQNCWAIVVDHVRRVRPARIAIVADADRAGQEGAHKVAGQLVAARLPVSVITVPDGAKDLRDWKRLARGTHHDLLAILERPANA